MANKFQKSVEERLKTEAQRQRQSDKEAPLQEKKGVPSRPTTLQERRGGPQTADNSIQKEIVKAAYEASQPDLSAYVNHPINREAKNKTFYHDEDVIQAIKQHASEQKMTESRLVNEILRRVLAL